MNNGRNLAFAEKNALEEIVIINSLVVGNLGKYHAGIEEVKNNSWQNGLSVDKRDFISLDASELSAPILPDGSLPEIDFMKLRNNSSLVDAGMDVGCEFTGSAPDIGAFENKEKN